MEEGNSIRSERWRYIRDKDELEWNNLAEKPGYDEVKKELSRWLPTVNAPDAPRRKNK